MSLAYCAMLYFRAVLYEKTGTLLQNKAIAVVIAFAEYLLERESRIVICQLVRGSMLAISDTTICYFLNRHLMKFHPRKEISQP